MVDLYQRPEEQPQRSQNFEAFDADGNPVQAQIDPSSPLAKLSPEQQQIAFDEMNKPPTGAELAQALAIDPSFEQKMTLDEFLRYDEHMKTVETDWIEGVMTGASMLVDDIGSGLSALWADDEKLTKAIPTFTEGFARGTRDMYGLVAQSQDPQSPLFRFKELLTGSGTPEERFEQFKEARDFNRRSIEIMNGNLNVTGIDKSLIIPETAQALSYIADPSWLVPFVGQAGKAAGITAKSIGLAKLSEQLAVVGAHSERIKQLVLGGAVKMAGVPMELMGNTLRNTIEYGAEKASGAFSWATGLEYQQARRIIREGGLAGGTIFRVPYMSTISDAYIGGWAAQGMGQAFQAIGDVIQNSRRGVYSYAEQAMMAYADKLSPQARAMLTIINHADPFFSYAYAGMSGAVQGAVIGGGLGYLSARGEGAAQGIGMGAALGAGGGLLGRGMASLPGRYSIHNQRLAVEVDMIIGAHRELGGSKAEMYQKIREAGAAHGENVDYVIAGLEKLVPDMDIQGMNSVEFEALRREMGIADMSNGSIADQLDLSDPASAAILRQIHNWEGFVLSRGSDGKVTMFFNTDHVTKNTFGHEMFHGVMRISPFQDEFIGRLRDTLLGKKSDDGTMNIPGAVDAKSVRGLMERYINLQYKNNPQELERKMKQLNDAMEAYEKDGTLISESPDDATPILNRLVEEFGAYYFTHWARAQAPDYLYRGGDLGGMRQIFDNLKNGWLDWLETKFGQNGLDFNGRTIDEAFTNDGKGRVRFAAMDLLMRDIVRMQAGTVRSDVIDLTQMSGRSQESFRRRHGLDDVLQPRKNGGMDRRRLNKAEESAAAKSAVDALDAMDQSLRTSKTVREGKDRVIVGELSDAELGELIRVGVLSPAKASRYRLFRDVIKQRGKGPNVFTGSYAGESYEVGTGRSPQRRRKASGDEIPVTRREFIPIELQVEIRVSDKGVGRFRMNVLTLDVRNIDTRLRTLWRRSEVQKFWGNDYDAFAADFYTYLQNASDPKGIPTADLFGGGEAGAAKRNIFHEAFGAALRSGEDPINKPSDTYLGPEGRGQFFTMNSLTIGAMFDVRLHQRNLPYDHSVAYDRVRLNWKPSEMEQEDFPGGRRYKHKSGYSFLEQTGGKVRVYSAGKDLIGIAGDIEEAANMGRRAWEANEKKLTKEFMNFAPVDDTGRIDPKDYVPPFYSALMRFVRDAQMGPNWTPDVTWARIRKANHLGIKMDEVRYSNVKEYLDSLPRNEPVDKQKLIEHLEFNALDMRMESEGAQYAAYVAPFGLQIDGSTTNPSMVGQRVIDTYEIVTVRSNQRSGVRGHFGEDVIVHVRVDERIDKDGKRSLFVNEVQANSADESLALKKKQVVGELQSIGYTLKEAVDIFDKTASQLLELSKKLNQLDSELTRDKLARNPDATEGSIAHWLRWTPTSPDFGGPFTLHKLRDALPETKAVWDKINTLEYAYSYYMGKKKELVQITDALVAQREKAKIKGESPEIQAQIVELYDQTYDLYQDYSNRAVAVKAMLDEVKFIGLVMLTRENKRAPIAYLKALKLIYEKAVAEQQATFGSDERAKKMRRFMQVEANALRAIDLSNVPNEIQSHIDSIERLISVSETSGFAEYQRYVFERMDDSGLLDVGATAKSELQAANADKLSWLLELAPHTIRDSQLRIAAMNIVEVADKSGTIKVVKTKLADAKRTFESQKAKQKKVIETFSGKRVMTGIGDFKTSSIDNIFSAIQNTLYTRVDPDMHRTSANDLLSFSDRYLADTDRGLVHQKVNDWGVVGIKAIIRTAAERGLDRVYMTTHEGAPVVSGMTFESAVSLYDQILPALTQSFLRQHGIELKNIPSQRSGSMGPDGQLTPGAKEVSIRQRAGQKIVLTKKEKGGHHYSYDLPKMQPGSMSDRQIGALIMSESPYFDITPELRKEALTEGFRNFKPAEEGSKPYERSEEGQRRDAAPRKLDVFPETPEFIKWAGKVPMVQMADIRLEGGGNSESYRRLKDGFVATVFHGTPSRHFDTLREDGYYGVYFVPDKKAAAEYARPIANDAFEKELMIKGREAMAADPKMVKRIERSRYTSVDAISLGVPDMYYVRSEKPFVLTDIRQAINQDKKVEKIVRKFVDEEYTSLYGEEIDRKSEEYAESHERVVSKIESGAMYMDENGMISNMQNEVVEAAFEAGYDSVVFFDPSINTNSPTVVMKVDGKHAANVKAASNTGAFNRKDARFDYAPAEGEGKAVRRYTDEQMAGSFIGRYFRDNKDKLPEGMTLDYRPSKNGYVGSLIVFDRHGSGESRMIGSIRFEKEERGGRYSKATIGYGKIKEAYQNQGYYNLLVSELAERLREEGVTEIESVISDEKGRPVASWKRAVRQAGFPDDTRQTITKDPLGDSNELNNFVRLRSEAYYAPAEKPISELGKMKKNKKGQEFSHLIGYHFRDRETGQLYILEYVGMGGDAMKFTPKELFELDRRDMNDELSADESAALRERKLAEVVWMKPPQGSSGLGLKGIEDQLAAKFDVFSKDEPGSQTTESTTPSNVSVDSIKANAEAIKDTLTSLDGINLNKDDTFRLFGRRSKTGPVPGIIDNINAEVSKVQRGEAPDVDKIESALSEMEEIRDELQEKLDNTPENLQDTEAYSNREEAIDAINEAIDEVKNLMGPPKGGDQINYAPADKRGEQLFLADAFTRLGIARLVKNKYGWSEYVFDRRVALDTVFPFEKGDMKTYLADESGVIALLNNLGVGLTKTDINYVLSVLSYLEHPHDRLQQLLNQKYNAADIISAIRSEAEDILEPWRGEDKDTKALARFVMLKTTNILTYGHANPRTLVRELGMNIPKRNVTKHVKPDPKSGATFRELVDYYQKTGKPKVLRELLEYIANMPSQGYYAAAARYLLNTANKNTLDRVARLSKRGAGGAYHLSFSYRKETKPTNQPFETTGKENVSVHDNDIIQVVMEEATHAFQISGVGDKSYSKLRMGYKRGKDWLDAMQSHIAKVESGVSKEPEDIIAARMGKLYIEAAKKINVVAVNGKTTKQMTLFEAMFDNGAKFGLNLNDTFNPKDGSTLSPRIKVFLAEKTVVVENPLNGNRQTIKQVVTMNGYHFLNLPEFMVIALSDPSAAAVLSKIRPVDMGGLNKLTPDLTKEHDTLFEQYMDVMKDFYRRAAPGTKNSVYAQLIEETTRIMQYRGQLEKMPLGSTTIYNNIGGELVVIPQPPPGPEVPKPERRRGKQPMPPQDTIPMGMQEGEAPAPQPGGLVPAGPEQAGEPGLVPRGRIVDAEAKPMPRRPRPGPGNQIDGQQLPVTQQFRDVRPPLDPTIRIKQVWTTDSAVGEGILSNGTGWLIMMVNNKFRVYNPQKQIVAVFADVEKAKDKAERLARERR